MEELTKEGLLALQVCSARNYTQNYVDDGADYYVGNYVTIINGDSDLKLRSQEPESQKPESQDRIYLADQRSEQAFESSSRLVGNVTVIIGPMFAGKTSALGQNVKRHTIAGRTGVIVRYIKDNRYDRGACDDGIVTHAGHEFPGIPTLRAGTLWSVLTEIRKYDVIGIDEVQFFPDILTITRMLANAGKIIICAGLDANSKGEPFGQVCNLIANAEEVIKLKAVCMNLVPKNNTPTICGYDASFTSRLNDEQAEEIIGGSELYIAVCRGCFCSRGCK